MLQSIRSNAQGILVWIIVGLIIITFALFGLGSYLSGTSKNIAASVNGQEITDNDLTRGFRNYQEQLMKLFGDSYKPEMFDEKRLKQQVLQGMVNQAVLEQMMEQNRITASNNQVAAQIQQIEAFQEDGKFSNSQYRKVLSLQGTSPYQFEMDMARDIATTQLRSGISGTAFVTAKEKQALYQLTAQQRDTGFLQIKSADFRQQLVTDDEIAAYYQGNQSLYMKPEQINMEYVELELKQMATKVAVSDDDIAQHYEENKAAYRQDDEEGARKSLQEMRSKIIAGSNFAELAKQHSVDPGSAKQGGDLGFFPRGVMVKPFEDAVFGMKVGDISQPIKTTHGFHLIKLDEVRKGDPEERRASHILIKPESVVQPLEQVRETIRKDLQTQEAEKNFYKQADRLTDLVYSSDSLSSAADALSLKVMESGFIPRRGGNGLFANPKVIQAAFSEEVLAGKNSTPVEITESHIVVVRKKEHHAASPRPLDEVKAWIRQQLESQKAAEQARNTAREILASLEKGESIEAIQKAYPNAVWQRTGLVSRSADQKTIPGAVRDQLFAMAWNPDKSPAWAHTEIPGGDQALVALYGVKIPDMDNAEADKQADQLKSSLGNSAYQAMVASLRSTASVKISEKEE